VAMAVVVVVVSSVCSSGTPGQPDVKRMELTLACCSLLQQEDGDEGIHTKRGMWTVFPRTRCSGASSCSFCFVWRSFCPNFDLGNAKTGGVFPALTPQ
jgi:hypothetical protein